MPQGKGWRKDPFSGKDYPRTPFRYGAAQVPDIVDLSALLAPRLDQDGMNGCVGAAIKTGVDACLISQKAYQRPKSWIWPWKGGRFIEGTLAQNTGTYPRDVFDWLLKQGCLDDVDEPFLGSFDATPPSSEQMSRAVKYADFAYFRVGDGAQGIMESLAESQASMAAGGPGWLICIGAPWPALWDAAPGGVLVDIPADYPMPVDASGNQVGHEWVVYGYNKPIQLLYMCNSWGTGWGANGLATFKFGALDAFKRWGGYDAQYLNFKAAAVPPVPVPVPTPTPVRPGCLPFSSILNLFVKK